MRYMYLGRARASIHGATHLEHWNWIHLRYKHTKLVHMNPYQIIYMYRKPHVTRIDSTYVDVHLAPVGPPKEADAQPPVT